MIFVIFYFIIIFNSINFITRQIFESQSLFTITKNGTGILLLDRYCYRAVFVLLGGTFIWKNFFSSICIQREYATKENISSTNPIIMLLGEIGTGKTRLYRQLCQGQKITESNHGHFVHADFENYNITIADTPSADFDTNIGVREVSIQKYQEYFQKFSGRIAIICILVNFERTDLMKKKIIAAWKHFRKLSPNPTIIVTNWQLSENKDADKEQLKIDLKHLKPQNILFVSSADDSGKFFSQFIKQNLTPINIDLQETLFEISDPQFDQQMNNQLNQIALAVQKNNNSGSEQLSLFTNGLTEVLVSK